MIDHTVSSLVVFISGQLLPNLFSILLLKPKEVVLVHTIDSRQEADDFSNFIAKKKYGEPTVRKVETVPFNPVIIRQTAERLWQSLNTGNRNPSEIILNYTCGTKPMSIQFANLFKKNGARLLYIDTQEETCWWEEKDAFTEKPLTLKLDIPEILTLKRSSIKDQADKQTIDELYDLTSFIFQTKKDKTAPFSKWQRKIPGVKKYNKEQLNNWNPDFHHPPLVINNIPSSGKEKASQMEVFFNDIPFVFKNNKNKEFWHSYFSGGWFEYFVYSKMKETDAYDDIQCNLRLRTTTGTEKQDIKNEIDVIAIKNGMPVFVECKTGIVQQDSVTKLKTVGETYGGRYSEIVLVSFYPVNTISIREKIEENGIVLIEGQKKIEKELPHLHEYMLVKK